MNVRGTELRSVAVENLLSAHVRFPSSGRRRAVFVFCVLMRDKKGSRRLTVFLPVLA